MTVAPHLRWNLGDPQASTPEQEEQDMELEQLPPFQMTPEQFDWFVKALDAPPNPSEQLKRTMNAPRPWKGET